MILDSGRLFDWCERWRVRTRLEKRGSPSSARSTIDPMGQLHTKNGKPLTVSGDNIFDRSGRHVGRRRGDKVYGPDGRYAGTIVGDIVVYRSTDSASIGSPFASSARAGSAQATRAGSALWGEEPFE
jgi:hypothetical protein